MSAFKLFRATGYSTLFVVVWCSASRLSAQAKVVTWSATTTPTQSFATFKCSEKGLDKIVVDGIIELKHPQDDPNADHPQRIAIECQTIEFRPGGEIRSISELDIRIFGTASGRIVLKNTRGTAGKLAVVVPENYQQRIAAKGPDGANGPYGHDARTDLNADRGADRGENGKAGTRGTDGKDGVEASPGGNAKSAANILFAAGLYAPGSSMLIEARGGAGAPGAKGARAEDGGAGGAGGIGGKGGDGNAFHSGESGGNGGNGGDGGDGGNGGKGGHGGNGGDGGRVTVARYEGAQSWSLAEVDNSGGTGGQGGEGGDPGEGGEGGKGGVAGCGGSGGSFIGVINTTGGGTCGTDGVRGKDGRRGRKGPPGAWGTDGRNGQQQMLDYVTLPRPATAEEQAPPDKSHLPPQSGHPGGI